MHLPALSKLGWCTIILAVTATTTGPFVAKEVVKGHFCHGPTPAFDPHTRTYLLMHDGDGGGGPLCPAADCLNGTTLPSSPCRAGAMGGEGGRAARGGGQLSLIHI